MAQELLRESYEILGDDFDKAGETATEIKQLLTDLALDASLVHRAIIIAFEAEMNVVMYASKATLTLVLTEDEIALRIEDSGPGIEDIELALTEGYSTATDEMRKKGFGFGMGLPNIKKNADEFDIVTAMGKGTSVSAKIGLNSDG